MIVFHIMEKATMERRRKEVVPAINAGLEAAIEFWWRKFLPWHFKSFASPKYNYERRSARYKKRKAQVKGHSNPLVWSGSLRRTMKRRIQIKSLKARPSAQGKMWGRALNFSGRAGMPDMRREVTETLQGEVNTMARVVRRVAAKRMNELHEPRTTLIR